MSANNPPAAKSPSTDAGHAPKAIGRDRAIPRRNVLRAGLYVSGGVTAASLLTACGSSAKNAATSDTLTIWHFFTGGNLALLNGWIRQFNAQYPHVKVDAVPVPAPTIQQKVIAAAAAHTGPDLIMFTADNAYQAYPSGALADISQYWSKSPQSFQADFPSHALLRSGQQLIGIRPSSNCVALWYNKDLLAKTNASIPTSLSSFHNSMAAVQKSNKRYLPLSLCGDQLAEGEWQAYPWLSGYGWTYTDPKLEPLLKTFSLLKSWIAAGFVTTDESTYTQASSFDRFLAGDTVFCENGNWNLQIAAKNAHFSYGVTALPSQGPIYIGGDGYCIGAFGHNPQHAWEFLKTSVLTPQGQLADLKISGNIPVRKSLANGSAVHGIKWLSVFASQIKARGVQNPPIINGRDIINAQLAVAQGWNAVMGGSASAEAAAKSTLSSVQSALKSA